MFFDEATSSLDATTERVIMHNLTEFYAERTVVVIAHRLSTVKSADNIVFIDKGRIVEQGTHEELIKQKGYYYTLVNNQLELNEKQYDYLVVGAGLFGATFAYRARQAGKRVLVIDKRSHTGGNVHCREWKAYRFICMAHISFIPRARRYGIL